MDSSINGGRAVLAREPIATGELLCVFGGAALHGRELDALTPDARRRILQVDEDIYLYSEVESVADWVNHCCEPNAGLRGQVALVALRAIAAGEEITYDYAMSDGSAYDGFHCQCGAPSCRGQISGDDWQLERLWAAYHGHFSPYLAERIAARRASRRPRAVRSRR